MILDASLEVRSPIVYATLIIVAAAFPVFFLQGLTGAFFRPLAVSYVLAIVASMVVALTVTPALCLILLRSAPIERRESPLVRGLQRGYVAALGRIAIAAAGRVCRGRRGHRRSAAFVVARRSARALFPTFQERDFLMHWVGKPGTSDAETARRPPRQQGDPRQSRACAASARTSARRCSARRSSA